MAIRLTPPPADIGDYLRYDPDTGFFYWRKVAHPSQVRRIGQRAAEFDVDSEGYARLTFRLRRYKAHRIAWFMMTGEWPDAEIDHADGDPSNNTWVNLRLADRSLQNANRCKRPNSSSQFKGVRKRPDERTWLASIKVRGVNIRLGRFETEEAAHAAYRAAAIKHFGEFARFQ